SPADAFEGAEERRFLSLERAARDDDEPLAGYAEEPQDAFNAVAARRRVRRHRIELQASGHRDARIFRAKVEEAIARRLALHQAAIDIVEDAPEETADEAVARVGTRRDPAVDEHRRHASGPEGAEKVRPD